MSQIIVPITDKNRQGIDDLIENVKTLFTGNLRIVEAYVVTTDNPGVEVVMQALAKKSGTVYEAPAPEEHNITRKPRGPRGSYKKNKQTGEETEAS